ncbi:YheC/YheD family protein [Peribacillus loiseleuriae]|uniref:Glutathione synthetase n=1 Tax=Peribacillus loiseleuriae TaxID=1679170 RepID=A0A0K9GQP1_9BACI|nr:YheC/YheD family protein [Peribacillus loiseleuriae]KMY48994.1 glutathione synthetase [Peribacillus loiseleuriae]
MKKIYPCEITDMLGDVFYYPSDLCGVVDFADKEAVCFGHRAHQADIRSNPSIRQTFALSRSLAETLYFPETETSLHVFPYQNSIHIGPLVGIFSAGFGPFLTKPLGERSSFFSKLLSLNKTTGCIPFIFGENHINWEQETIRGYVYQDNQWDICEFPFPNVIYDRLPNRKTENKTGPKEVKRKFQTDYSIPWYNPGFFNKWDVYERLIDDERAIPYLPVTYPFQSFSIVETMLSEHRQVYIKPIHGSLGLGIHQVLYDKHDDVYYCRYRDHENENRLKRFSTLESMLKHVFKNKRIDHLIVQQGISLIRNNRRPIDFRVHTNKDLDGDWQVTAIAAKIAGEGSITTHVKNGGTIMTLDELFGDDDTVFEVHQQLSKAALILSEAIEEHLDGIVAEIGFDLGLDKQGQVWMFEANSKPGRSIFSHPKLREFELLTRKLALDYAVYLTEQSLASTGGLQK